MKDESFNDLKQDKKRLHVVNTVSEVMCIVSGVAFLASILVGAFMHNAAATSVCVATCLTSIASYVVNGITTNKLGKISEKQKHFFDFTEVGTLQEENLETEKAEETCKKSQELSDASTKIKTCVADTIKNSNDELQSH